MNEDYEKIQSSDWIVVPHTWPSDQRYVPRRGRWARTRWSLGLAGWLAMVALCVDQHIRCWAVETADGQYYMVLTDLAVLVIGAVGVLYALDEFGPRPKVTERTKK